MSNQFESREVENMKKESKEEIKCSNSNREEQHT